MRKATQILLSATVLLSLGTLSVNADRSASNSHGPGTATDNISNVTAVGQGFIASGTDAAGAAASRSTAEFEVTPGNLTLDGVPNLKFASTNVGNIVKGDTTVKYTSGAVSSNANNQDGNANSLLSVTDFTGSNNGWNVLASLGQFSNAKGGTVDNASLTLAAGSATSDSKLAKPGTVTLASNASNDASKSVQENSIWQAAKDLGEGSNVANYGTPDTQLLVNKQNNIQPGTYQATLYWSLVNAPSAGAAQG